MLLKSMNGMTSYGNLFSDGLIEYLLEVGFIQSKCQISIFYNYAPDGEKILFYFILMTVYIGILMKLLENGLWVI